MQIALLQPWTTIRNNGTAPFTQDCELWADVGSFSDAVFWIDVADTVVPAFSLQLTMQTSPSRDEAYFRPIAPPVTFPAPGGSGGAPIVVKSIRAASTVPLARWIRWQLALSNLATGAWGATFRVRAALSKQPFFSPTQLSGCVLWLRSDLGIALNSGNVGSWADQSGKGHNFSNGSAPNQPSYVANAYGNLPAVRGDNAASKSLAASWSLSASGMCIFAVGNQVGGASSYMLCNGGDTDAIILGFGVANRIEWDNGPLVDRHVFSATPGTGLHIMSVNQTDGVSEIGYFDGVQAYSAIPVGVTGSIQVLLNASQNGIYGSSGDLMEVLQWNRPLSSVEQNQVTRYLGSRYGIAVP
jgi:hypothetical protein